MTSFQMILAGRYIISRNQKIAKRMKQFCHLPPDHFLRPLFRPRIDRLPLCDTSAEGARAMHTIFSSCMTSGADSSLFKVQRQPRMGSHTPYKESHKDAIFAL